MNQALPVTISKSVVGLVGIFLLAVASLTVVFWGFVESLKTPWADPLVMFSISTLTIALIAAFFVVWIRVYSLSSITLTTAGISVTYWATLFHRQVLDTEWSDVEDVSAVTSGIFAQLLDFGTVNVQTAGTRQNIRMTMVPNAEYWRQVINERQDAATANQP